MLHHHGNHSDIYVAILAAANFYLFAKVHLRKIQKSVSVCARACVCACVHPNIFQVTALTT